jgi:hypothetical protein
MNAREQFQNMVVPSYDAFAQNPSDFHLLGNALLSMNTVPEYVGLDRRGYPSDISRNERHREAQAIREHSGLKDLQTCADVIKHVRIEQERDGVTSTLSSTGIDPNDQTTWNIGRHNLVKVAHDAFATLKEFPELK